jgi:hypothetical protein
MKKGSGKCVVASGEERESQIEEVSSLRLPCLQDDTQSLGATV